MVGKDGTSGIGNGHLRTGMQFQFRYRAAAKPDDAKILDNNAINTDIAEERDIVPQRLHFLISDKGIDRDIDTNMVQVSKSDGPLQFFRAKIFGIGPSAKSRATQLNRIGTGKNSRLKGLPGPSRGQKFNIFSSHENLLIYRKKIA